MTAPHPGGAQSGPIHPLDPRAIRRSEPGLARPPARHIRFLPPDHHAVPHACPAASLTTHADAFTLNGTWLGLYGREALAEDATVSSGGEGFGGFALAHNVGSEEEEDEVVAQAVGAGAVLVKEPQKEFWGGYSVYFKDPDGHLWEGGSQPILLGGTYGRRRMPSGVRQNHGPISKAGGRT